MVYFFYSIFKNLYRSRKINVTGFLYHVYHDMINIYETETGGFQHRTYKYYSVSGPNKHSDVFSCIVYRWN